MIEKNNQKIVKKCISYGSSIRAFLLSKLQYFDISHFI